MEVRGDSMRAALYARYSSDNQRYESISGQFHCSEDYCRYKGYNIVHYYYDEAKTGTTVAGREQFNQMIEDAAKNIFDVVIFYQIDRTARNEIDYYANVNKLLGLGISYEYSAEGIDVSTPNGKLTEGVKVAVAAFYSRDLSVKIKRGKKENVLQSKHNGGIPPLGYDVDQNGKYVVNESEAVAVKRIFEMKLAGEGYGKIVDWLKAHGYKTKRGGSYSKVAIHDILCNRKYIGILELGKTTKHSSRKKAEGYMEIKNAIPKIIDSKDFAAVQEMMATRRNGRNRAKEVYALSGRIFCQCGAAMTGSRVGAKGNKYSYYACGNQRYKHGDCDIPMVRKEKIEYITYLTIVDYIKANKQSIIEEFLRQSENSEDKLRMNELQQNIEKQKNKAKKLLALYDGEDDLVLESYKEAKRTLDMMEAEFDSLVQCDMADINREVLEVFIDSFFVEAGYSDEFLRQFFNSLNVKVLVNQKNAEIHLNLSVSPFVVALKGIEPLISP